MNPAGGASSERRYLAPQAEREPLFPRWEYVSAFNGMLDGEAFPGGFQARLTLLL